MKTYTFHLLTIVVIISTIKLNSQTNTLNIELDKPLHTIDGFGAHQSGDVLNQSWWNQLFSKTWIAVFLG